MVAIDGGRERNHVRKIESEVGEFKDQDREEEREIRCGKSGEARRGRF